MEQYVTCWKKVQDHNCRLNSSLRMGFEQLMDTCKMNLLKKKIIKNKKNPQPKNLKNAMYR